MVKEADPRQMNAIPKYNFYRRKYGNELLIDVIDLESIKGNIRRTPVHRLFISTNYLNRIVRQTLGVITKQYIQNKVMQEAKRLLTYTTLSVAEIAAALHVETASYFIRFFRTHTGCTPGEYREQAKC